MQARNGGSVFGALLIGGLGGILLGVLFAPHRGEKTRDMLNKRAADYRDQAGKLYEDSLSRVGDAMDKGRIAANDTGKQLKTDVEEGRGHLHKYVAKSAKIAESALDKAAKTVVKSI